MAVESWRTSLLEGHVIPACPLMLSDDGSWSRRHQRAVIRYYCDAGAGGVAVAVHSTQFAVRSPQHGLFEPILRLVAEELDRFDAAHPQLPPRIRIAGVCGAREQAEAEAELARGLGYHAGLLSLAAVGAASESEIVEHCRRVSQVIPLIGFYLQPAVGGRVLPYSFWRQFAEIPNVAAIKIAPFDRYRTLDVVRAVAESGRDDIALYTGNDDNIVVDLLTPFEFGGSQRFIVGGLLGQWGVWTRRAVEMLAAITAARTAPTLDRSWLTVGAALTDANGAIFDVANGFAGCIPGIMEMLRRDGLAPSIRCLDPAETLSPGQSQELDRVVSCYPELTDDEFVKANLGRWLESEDEE